MPGPTISAPASQTPSMVRCSWAIDTRGQIVQKFRRTRSSAVSARRYSAIVLSLASVSLVALLLLTQSATADQWSIVGVRYQGMSGAGVATVNDSLASYWNPGALAFAEDYDVTIPVGAQASIEGGILGDLNDIADLASSDSLKDVLNKIEDGNIPLDASDEEAIQDALELANRFIDLEGDAQGIVGSVHTGLWMRYKRVAVAGSGIGYFGAQTIADLQNLGLFKLDEGLSPEDAAAAALVGAFSGLANSAPGGIGTRSLSVADQAFADSLAAKITGTFGGLDTKLSAELTGFDTGVAAEELVYQSSRANLNTSNKQTQDILTSVLTATAGLDSDGNPQGEVKTLKESDNGARIRGAAIASANFGYGHPIDVPIPLPFISEGVVGIGGNVKVMRGTTYEKLVTYDDADDLADELLDLDNTKDTWDWGLDVGMLYKPVTWARIGVVARNVNTPSFKYKSGGKYELEPQVRAGIAVDIFPIWVVAMDYDLTVNETDNLDGYKSQVIALGTELRLPLGPVGLALRGGASIDRKSSDESIVPSAGFAIKFWHLQLEAAGSYSPDSEEIEGEDVPNRFSASVGLKFQKTF